MDGLAHFLDLELSSSPRRGARIFACSEQIFYYMPALFQVAGGVGFFLPKYVVDLSPILWICN